MAVPENIKTEAARIGYSVWIIVDDEAVARETAYRKNLENKHHDCSIGLMPDGSWVVWYKK